MGGERGQYCILIVELMQNSDFFVKLDEKTNERISSSLLLVLLAIPAVAVLSVIGVFAISLQGLLQFSIVGAIGLVTPKILHRAKLGSEFLKYYIITVVSIMISMLATQPHIGIYITYVLAMIVSVFYIDPKLTKYSAVLCYVLMMCALYFREAAAMAELQTDTPLHAWLAYGMGFTLEFIIVTPLFMSIVKIMRRHLIREEKLVAELKNENERYTLALENSKDVLYELDMIKDVLKYYGALYPGDDSLRHSAHYIEDFSDKINSGKLIHEEDIAAYKEFLDRDCSGRVELRLLLGNGQIHWIEIEGYVKYQHNKQSRIVGRIKDINLEKIEEESRILEGEGKDELTGFYERTAGIRIIRRYRSDMLTGYHYFVYASFLNAAQIRARAGSVFCDAIIFRIANIFYTELRSTDVAVRFSNDEFILFFQDRTPTMIEQTISALQEKIAGIFVGEGIAEFINVDFKTYETIQALENDVLNSDLVKDIDVYEEYSDDVVLYAFNTLNHSTDHNDTINSLLERIGRRYSLEYVRILEESPVSSIQYCVNEWFDEGSLETSMYGEAISIQRMKNSPTVYVCDSKELGNDYINVVFSGSAIAGDFKDSICAKLQELAHIISVYIMKFRYENDSKVKTDFISSMSRDIRTPMSAIAGYAELMLLENTSDTVADYANNIIVSSNGMLSTINDMIDASKFDSGKFEIILVQYYMHEIVQELKSVISIQLKNKNIEFVTEVDENMPDGLIGDDVRIKQVMLNLLNNSVKFTDSGKITLKIGWNKKEDGGIAIITVKDTGTGIKKEVLDTIFSMDYESSTDGSAAAEKSIALALTRNIVEAMGGSINVSSEFGVGTEFVIELPQSVFDEKAFDYGTKDKKKKAAFVIPFTTIDARALVVDDNQVNLQVVKGLLSKYQISVELVKSGQGALDILEKDQNFDIIFMDHMMPEMDGIQCTEHIRSSENERLHTIPIVALTANAMKGIEDDFANAGMDGYLAKPVNLKELCGVLETFLSEEKRIYIQAPPES